MAPTIKVAVIQMYAVARIDAHYIQGCILMSIASATRA
jgi:hypothetical protein